MNKHIPNNNLILPNKHGKATSRHQKSQSQGEESCHIMPHASITLHQLVASSSSSLTGKSEACRNPVPFLTLNANTARQCIMLCERKNQLPQKKQSMLHMPSNVAGWIVGTPIRGYHNAR